jgi:hypothetical protein
MRGKAAAKGAAASADDAGSQSKLHVLAMAMRRLNGERKRREKMGNRLSLTQAAHRALAMKQEADAENGPDFNTRTAHKGMRKVSSDRRKNLVRPMELGRQRKAGAVAQAKRDGR